VLRASINATESVAADATCEAEASCIPKYGNDIIYLKTENIFSIEQTLNRHAYLECIRKNFCNNHPDHASSSEPRTKWQELTKCIGTNK